MKNLLLIIFLAFSAVGLAQNCTVAATVPYSEDFSAGAPACWTYENTDNANPVWAYNNSIDLTGNGTNDPFVGLVPQNAAQREKDDWAFTRKIQMEAGTEYQISIDYNSLGLGNAVADENFELVITDAPNSTATFSEIIGTYNNILQQGTFPGNGSGNDIKTNAYNALESFTPTTSGEYYVAIHAIGASGTDSGVFLVFKTSVEEAPIDCTTAAIVPYLEDFSNGDPACWAYENTDGIAPEWTYLDAIDLDGDGTDDPFYGLIPQAVQFTEKDDWAFSKKIQMEAGTQYYVSALYNALNLGNATAFESFELVITDAQNATATFSEVLGTYTDIAQQGVFPGQNNGNDVKSQAYRSEEPFMPNVSGEYYVAIHATGATGNEAGGFALFEVTVNTDPIVPICTAATVPYTEDMSNGTPECWEYENTDNTLPMWAYNDQTDITGDGNNDPLLNIIAPNAGTPSKDDWAFTRKIALIAGTEYLIETDYNALNLGNGTASENFELVITDEPNSSAAFQTILGTYNDILQQGTFPGQNDGNDLKTQAYTASETFTPTTSGEYYVAVHAMGGTVAGGFLLFDMNVSVNIIPSDGELIVLPNATFSGVNSNGSAAAGYNDLENIMWVEADGFTNIGGINPGNGTGGDVEMSNDGNKIVGPYLNPASNAKEMSIYDVPSQTWTPLGGIGGQIGDQISSAWGISPDGSTVVGLGWLPGTGAHAIYWTESSGIVDLGSTVTDRSTRADAASEDGSVMVGWQDSEFGFRQAAVWTNGVQQLLYLPTGERAAAAGVISDDAVWVGGEGSSANSFQAYRWSEATGIENIGPPLQPGWRGATTGMSGDGSVIVGFYRPQGPALFGSGFIWTEALGVTDLNTYANSLGIDTQGIIMSLPLNISADGTTIVGAGRDSNYQRVGFILKLEPTILAVENNATTQEYTLYPNPVRDVLHIKSPASFERIMLFNINGQLILNEAANSTNKELNVSALSSGIYLVKVVGNNTVETFKIVKQ
ncbi:T9SS type A sorting domain-containing protein [Aequorivita todarodis]|uniref:T9SS type A sorting domain-containing protein n=1 Tax=Aequorivita todarodis TaxID=2036821 RepID=UPI00234FC570|nr:T9SS type A sorting domain-containing protein [Aequorivita todarodis]MDC7999875.1 T9SS type A sorting domain-containing protein [Aequorivita todarodis]